MSRAVLRVLSAGPLVTYQDAGRPGMLRFGVPQSGPMDPFAHAVANVVLGMPARSTAVEVSLGGLSVECIEGSVTTSRCGGMFSTRHNGERCEPWGVRTLRCGDTFTIGAGASGSWCYLAVAGKLRAGRSFGSTSTHVRAGLGGGLIVAGDELVIDDAVTDEARDGHLEPPASVVGRATGGEVRLRVVLGPQLGCFGADAVDTLLGHPFVLTAAYDRMGVRLEGPHLAIVDALAIASTPIVRGSIQVAGDGVATLLLADHQTTGGYPKLATLLADDVTVAVQLRAGQAVCFDSVEPATAVAIARRAAHERALMQSTLSTLTATRSRLGGANLIGGVIDLAGLDDDTEPR